MADYRYPFGRPLRAVHPAASGTRRIFVLGAYPSALHVHWTPPAHLGLAPVQALAVDDEPEPFWNGAAEQEQVAAWEQRVDAQPGWGALTGARRFNGSSGRHLDQQYLAPLGVQREQVWITDTVNTYFVSEAGANAIATRYGPAAAALGLPVAQLPERPTAEELIIRAAKDHADRLHAELEEAAPEHVLTIGNEALAALWQIGVTLAQGGTRPGKLSAACYGRRLTIRLGNGHVCLLHPLAHPNLLFNPHPGRDTRLRAGVEAYRAAHSRWADEARRDLAR